MPVYFDYAPSYSTQDNSDRPFKLSKKQVSNKNKRKAAKKARKLNR